MYVLYNVWCGKWCVRYFYKYVVLQRWCGKYFYMYVVVQRWCGKYIYMYVVVQRMVRKMHLHVCTMVQDTSTCV